MLQLILGRSGSGKTEEIWKRLQSSLSAADATGNYVLLVPEQFSFETERTLLRRLGPALSLRVKVYSFTRMAEMVRREVGGRSGSPMLPSTRVVLLSKTLRELSDHLRVYASQYADTSRLHALMALMEEFRGCGITSDTLAKLSEETPVGGLKNKLHDLALIDEGYRALVEQAYLDPMDDLTHLAEDLPQSAAFRGSHVFIDGFKSFTGQQKRILDVLLPMAAEVTVSLCCDPYGDLDESDVFADAFATASELENTARRLGVTLKTPLRLIEDHRHAHSPALAALESGLYGVGDPYEGEQLPVELMAADSLYEECSLAVRRIHRFLREGGRCREATVVVRDLGKYAGVLEPMLRRAGIPYDLDRRDSVRVDPLIVTAVEALRCVTSSWQTESLLRLMKTGLLGFSRQSISLVENYAYTWNLRASDWKKEWTAHPDGFGEEMDESALRRLWYLNILRRRLVTPLLQLQESLKNDCTGRAFAEALYHYLKQAQVARLVRMRVRSLKAGGETDLADRSARTWDMLMQILDQFAAAGGEETQSTADFTALFTLSADITDMGTIPSAIDAVQITQADRVRYSSPRLVLILGANAGVFPAASEVNGILSDSERRYLISDYQLPLTDVSSHRLLEERTFVYNAVAAPSEQLYVSYLSKSDDGEAMEPSSLIAEMKKLLPALKTDRNRPQDAETAEELLGALTAHWHGTDTVAASLHKACFELADTKERAALMKRATEPRILRFQQPETAKKLFTKLYYLSPSAVDQFYGCHFRYFCDHGLKLRKRPKAELDGVNFGNASHYVMEHCIPEYVKSGFDKLRKEDVEKDAAARVREYVEKEMGGFADKSERFLYLLSRVERLSGLMLWQCVRELKQSRFTPCAYELPIGDDPEDGTPFVPPMTVKLSDGSSVRVIGTIDRVDMYKAGKQIYLRVVDYKTYDKSFVLNDVINGIDLQMLLYLFALQANGKPKDAEDIITPAGVLYLPAKLPVVTANVKDPERSKTKKMQMSGLLLDTEDVLRAMENPLEGLFIPVTVSEKNGVSRTNLATLAQFGQLRRRAEKLLRQMAETLRNGEVEPLPYRCGSTDGCAFCDYASICGIRSDSPRNEPYAMNNQEIFDLLCEEDEDAAIQEEEATP